MILKLKKNATQNSFIKDSFLLYLVNILTGVTNFIIVPVAFRILGKESSDLWVALSFLVLSLLTLISGLNTEIIKTTTSLYSKDTTLAFEYYFSLRKNLINFTFLCLLCSPILIWPIDKIINSSNLWISLITVIYLAISAISNSGTAFLLGVLDIKFFALTTILTNLFKVSFALSGLYLGFGVISLPVSLLLSALVGFLINEYLINLKKHKLKILTIKNYIIDIKEKVLKSLKSGFLSIILQLLFSLHLILSRQIIVSAADRDLQSVLSFFGNIVFFASSSLASGILPHAIKNGENKKFFLLSTAFITAISSFIVICTLLFYPILLRVQARSEYINRLPEIFAYCLFVLFYIIIFVSIQYLLAHSKYAIANFTFISLCLMMLGLSLISQNILPFAFLGFNTQLWNVLVLNICLSLFTAISIVVAVLLLPKKAKLE